MLAPLLLVTMELRELRKAGDSCMAGAEEERLEEEDADAAESSLPSSPTSCEMPAYSIS